MKPAILLNRCRVVVNHGSTPPWRMWFNKDNNIQPFDAKARHDRDESPVTFSR
uniref:Uncharacterized protein n=1 Tax=uncultured Rhodospirillales bacterium HF0200_01O14 TaxID=710787 RepID=E0XTW1_9PROT|nr:hypothetical protein [uncultured Rhodospirillales bacterium HF0200_01O14]